MLTNSYEELLGNPNGWLHETVCEIASIFAIQRMARQFSHAWTLYRSLITPQLRHDRYLTGIPSSCIAPPDDAPKTPL